MISSHKAGIFPFLKLFVTLTIIVGLSAGAGEKRKRCWSLLSFVELPEMSFDVLEDLLNEDGEEGQFQPGARG